MTDVRCSVLKSDYVVSSNTSVTAARFRSLVVGSALPQTNLDVCCNPSGSADFSGRVFIRTEQPYSPQGFFGYSLHVNKTGTCPQIILSNVVTNPLPATYPGRGPADWPSYGFFNMHDETSAFLNISVKSSTSITPYLSLGNDLCPVKVANGVGGDTATGALIVNGGICAKQPSTLRKCCFYYGTECMGEYLCGIHNQASGSAANGYYPFLMIHNRSDTTTPWSVFDPTAHHVNFRWREASVTPSSECTLDITTYSGLRNSTIVFSGSAYTNTSTDPANVNHYNARMYLPSPRSYTNSHTDAALDINGGAYIGGLANVVMGVTAQSLRFGNDTTANSITSYESRTLATAWTFGTDAYAQAVSYQKLGRLVTLTPTAVMTAAFTTASTDATILVLLNAQLPETCRPAALVSAPYSLVSGTAMADAVVNVDTAGSVYISDIRASNATQIICTPFSFRSAS